MQNIACLPNSDREDLFRNTAAQKHLHSAIIEKDFWVCYTLDYLFHRSPWQKNFAFKGGTSLSKAYDLIQRFSEDIDLILDWRILGYEAMEPWQQRSKNQQDKFNKAANKRAEDFLLSSFIPQIKEDISAEMKQEAHISIDTIDKQTVIFSYPNIFDNSSTLRQIRLEIGALAAWTPTQTAEISSYAAECYERLFTSPSTTVLTAAPERTFWEKITILHQEANRPENTPMPQRYFRHYYDIYRMYSTPVKVKALSQLDLLEKVITFKSKFYPAKWAHFETAVPGSIKLIPSQPRFAELISDYKAMRDMFYGDVPTFEEVIATLRILEEEINTLKSSIHIS